MVIMFFNMWPDTSEGYKRRLCAPAHTWWVKLAPFRGRRHLGARRLGRYWGWDTLEVWSSVTWLIAFFTLFGIPFVSTGIQDMCAFVFVKMCLDNLQSILAVELG